MVDKSEVLNVNITSTVWQPVIQQLLVDFTDHPVLVDWQSSRYPTDSYLALPGD